MCRQQYTGILGPFGPPRFLSALSGRADDSFEAGWSISDGDRKVGSSYHLGNLSFGRVGTRVPRDELRQLRQPPRIYFM